MCYPQNRDNKMEVNYERSFGKIKQNWYRTGSKD